MNRISYELGLARRDEPPVQAVHRSLEGFEPPLPRPSNPVTLRFASPDDVDAIARLAGTDSSGPPAMPVLLAEVGDELHAALSLADGHIVADPFRHTAAIIELLQARARQLSDTKPGRRLRPPGARQAIFGAIVARRGRLSEEF